MFNIKEDLVGNLITEFITVNKLTLSRTQEELIAKLEKESKYTMCFGLEPLFTVSPLLLLKPYMDKERYAKYESNEEMWTISSLDEVVKEFLEYMVFAWDKALSERGLSASRSIIKLSSWLWLMGKDDLVEVIEDDYNYTPYGAPALVKVCEALFINVPEELIEFSKVKS